VKKTKRNALYEYRALLSTFIEGQASISFVANISLRAMAADNTAVVAMVPASISLLASLLVRALVIVDMMFLSVGVSSYPL
jgi:hypothetical protein